MLSEQPSMAANKFATMLHRSTHKILVVLVYAMLEWVLIMLLLFNSFFYYFIKKFANFFGLRPPCLWCSSVYHLSHPGRKDGSYDDLFCEAHAEQVSKLSYCESHKKLVEIQNRCQECSSSQDNGNQVQCSQGVDLISWMEQNGGEDGHVKEITCSCCGKIWKRDPPHLMFKDMLDVIPKEGLRVQEIEEEKDTNGGHREGCNMSNEEPHILSDVGSFYLQEAAEEDSSRSTSNSLCNENMGNEDEDVSGVEIVGARIEFCSLKTDQSTEAVSLSADYSCSIGGLREMCPALPTECSNSTSCDESGDANANYLQAKQFMELNCVIKGDDGERVTEEEKEDETKCVEIEKEEVGGMETSISCKSDLEKQDLASGYEEELLNGSETTANEALHNHPDGKQNEEAHLYPNYGKDEKQSSSYIEESKVDYGSDPALAVEQLRSELESERKARRDLSAELEAERSAAAIAANQTMAMITRLQEEKAAIKTEAVQYQRMMEEQAEYDQEALQLLNELVIKREKEKQELEKELEMYRERVLNYEAKEKVMTIRQSGSSSPSCSLNDDSDKLSIDLNCEVGEDRESESKEESSTGVVLNSVDMVLHRVKNWNMLDGSFEEFEQERLSILNQLKELEEKLFSICDDDDDQEKQLPFEDVKPIEHFLEQQLQHNELKEENADLCSAEVNLAPAGCLAELTLEKSHPTTLAAAAKKLLPLLEQEDGDTVQVGLDEKKVESDHKAETEDKVLAIMKEMDHVYKRLHALEADREFLRHCITSLNKGDKGVDLLGEILQHLRELRNADTSELMICQA